MWVGKRSQSIRRIKWASIRMRVKMDILQRVLRGGVRERPVHSSEKCREHLGMELVILDVEREELEIDVDQQLGHVLVLASLPEPHLVEEDSRVVSSSQSQ